MYVFFFSVFLFYCVGRVLETGQSPFRGVLPYIYKTEFQSIENGRPRIALINCAIQEEEK
jgi:hypothetical protein